MDAAGALLFTARLARRSAASRLSSACFVETVAICAARRSAELGRRVVGCTETVTFCLTAIAVSFSISLMSADHGIRGSRVISSIFCPGLLAPARLVVRAHQVGVAPVPRIVWICFGPVAIRTPDVQPSSGVN
jgi:hypothetical protein